MKFSLGDKPALSTLFRCSLDAHIKNISVTMSLWVYLGLLISYVDLISIWYFEFYNLIVLGSFLYCWFELLYRCVDHIFDL